MRTPQEPFDQLLLRHRGWLKRGDDTKRKHMKRFVTLLSTAVLVPGVAIAVLTPAQGVRDGPEYLGVNEHAVACVSDYYGDGMWTTHKANVCRTASLPSQTGAQSSVQPHGPLTLRAAPNPSSGEFLFPVGRVGTPWRLYLYDVLGRVVGHRAETTSCGVGSCLPVFALRAQT